MNICISLLPVAHIGFCQDRHQPVLDPEQWIHLLDPDSADFFARNKPYPKTRYCRGVPDPKIRIFDVGLSDSTARLRDGADARARNEKGLWMRKSFERFERGCRNCAPNWRLPTAGNVGVPKRQSNCILEPSLKWILRGKPSGKEVQHLWIHQLYGLHLLNWLILVQKMFVATSFIIGPYPY